MLVGVIRLFREVAIEKGVCVGLQLTKVAHNYLLSLMPFPFPLFH